MTSSVFRGQIKLADRFLQDLRAAGQIRQELLIDLHATLVFGEIAFVVGLEEDLNMRRRAFRAARSQTHAGRLGTKLILIPNSNSACEIVVAQLQSQMATVAGY